VCIGQAKIALLVGIFSDEAYDGSDGRPGGGSFLADVKLLRKTYKSRQRLGTSPNKSKYNVTRFQTDMDRYC
jgi:hypothetical protein